MTPSRPSLNGSAPAILTVLAGARRLPDRRRRKVVLPDPLAFEGSGLLGRIHFVAEGGIGGDRVKWGGVVVGTAY